MGVGGVGGAGMGVGGIDWDSPHHTLADHCLQLFSFDMAWQTPLPKRQFPSSAHFPQSDGKGDGVTGGDGAGVGVGGSGVGLTPPHSQSGVLVLHGHQVCPPFEHAAQFPSVVGHPCEGLGSATQVEHVKHGFTLVDIVVSRCIWSITLSEAF